MQKPATGAAAGLGNGDQAAVRAANQWVFRPATMDGQPVALAVTIELVFTLR